MADLVKLLEVFVEELSNEDTVKVFKRLYGDANVSEFDLAEELNLGINYVRNLLYRLHNHNLVTFNRKKDREKGWYIYYWTFNLKYGVDMLIKRKEKRLRFLEKSISDKGEIYYVCPDKHVRFGSVDALDHGFKCPECEQVLIGEDIGKIKELFNNEIKQIKEDISLLKKPIELPKEEKSVRKPRKVVRRKAVKRKPRKRVTKKKPKRRKVTRKPGRKQTGRVTKSGPRKRIASKKPVRKVKRPSSRRKIVRKPRKMSRNKTSNKSKRGFLRKIKRIKKRVGF